jgi:hypothetical protein
MAFNDGAFGLPWFTCINSEGKTEGFWGLDHLGQVSDFLGLDRPRMGGWKALLLRLHNQSEICTEIIIYDHLDLT